MEKNHQRGEEKKKKKKNQCFLHPTAREKKDTREPSRQRETI